MIGLLDDLHCILGRPNVRHCLRLKGDPSPDIGCLAAKELEFRGDAIWRPAASAERDTETASGEEAA